MLVDSDRKRRVRRRNVKNPSDPQRVIDVQIDPSFVKSIDYLDLNSIFDSNDVIYIVDEKFVLRAFNEAWVDFAKNNGGKSVLVNYPIGTSIISAIPPELEGFYIGVYKKVLKGGQPFHHDCECSSANTFRVLHQTIYPLLDAKGLVISDHFIVECDHTEKPHEFNEKFVNEHGFVVQCSNCRKLRDPLDKNTWLWVPSAVETIPINTSHGICPRCLDHYFYSELEE